MRSDRKLLGISKIGLQSSDEIGQLVQVWVDPELENQKLLSVASWDLCMLGYGGTHPCYVR